MSKPFTFGAKVRIGFVLARYLLALGLLLIGIAYAGRGEYAHGGFDLILSFIIGYNADRSFDALKKEYGE